jgi:hypothetical protein
MSLLRNRGSKKSATPLHAVPETTEYPTTLPSDEATASSRSRVLSADLVSSPLSYNETSPSRAHSRSSSALFPTHPQKVEDVKSIFSNTSSKGSIGGYKNGRIQWRNKDRNSSASASKNASGADKTPKPKIHVVIPSGTRERPLPAIPFFKSPNKNHITTASIERHNALDVSPASANTKTVGRDSLVSPLSHTQSNSFGQFQRSMSRVIRKPSVQTPQSHCPVSKPGGSSVDSHDSDSASTYSNRSSETSLEAESSPLSTKQTRHYTARDHIVASALNSSSKSYINRLSPPSSSRPRQYAHHPRIEQDHVFQPTCSLQRTRNASGTLVRQSTIHRKSSKHGNRRRSLVTTNGVIDGAIDRTTPRQRPSPTLTEAENELEEQLTSFTEDSKSTTTADENQGLTALTEDRPFVWDSVVREKASHETINQLRKDSATDDMTFTVPPAVPRKSSKRQASVRKVASLSRIESNRTTLQMERARSSGRNSNLTITIPECQRMTEIFDLSPIPIPAKHIKRTITPSCAEDVILNIFRSLDHLNDLFATAVVNHGFYRVFKRYELDLIKMTFKKMSPPAWEFREIAFPGHDLLHDEDLEMTRPQEEYTPSTYLQLQKRDIRTVRAIKLLIRERCQSFIRPEIAIALISSDPEETVRIDNALWRIWTFCKIFGSGKGREEDIVAQQDWLRGGVMAHQQSCTYSILSTDYMNDTLLGAPECFAQGNEGGLSAEQLFDMMELWNCLSVLLQGFEGRTAQARKHGIYDNTDIRGGDIDGEEAMLGMSLLYRSSRSVLTIADEWCYYLLTFGLSTVLDLAGPCHQMSANAFEVAAQQGWTNWTPMVFGGTRRSFLKEAASRVYEDKIAHTYATTSTRDIQRQVSKQRLQNHVTELRHRKTNGPRLPMIRMSQERPMSEWSTVMSNLTRAHPDMPSENKTSSHVPTLRLAPADGLIAELPTTRSSAATRSSSPRRTVAQPLLPTPPPSTVPSVRDRNSIAMSMPSIEEHPAYRGKDENIPAVPSLINHPAFRHHNPVTAPLYLHPQAQSQRHFQRQHHSHTHSSSDHSVTSGDHPVFQQHPTQHDIFASEAHENTAEKAIYRIVEMGFTPEQARAALRMTDLGDGLRVDSAVELLLSRRYRI